MTKSKLVGRYVRVNCCDTEHFIDLLNEIWDEELMIYSCDECRRPMVVRGKDGFFYFVGKRFA